MTKKRRGWIKAIEEFPDELTQLVSNLSDNLLTKSIVRNGWTIAQNIHHIADADSNKMNLIKEMLVSENPKLVEFSEEKWADLSVSKEGTISESLLIIRAVHKKAVKLLKRLKDKDWKRVGNYPNLGKITIENLVESFSTHGPRHIIQVNGLLKLINR
jgi:hypothetical protein